jgi:hypothetical protein
MNFDSTFEIILNDFSKKIIFLVVEISLIEQINDILVEKFAIRSSKIQFIFEESIRVEIDSIVVLSEVKNLREIVYRCRFDDDHVDEQIKNLLHERFNKSKSDESDLKNSIDQCEFISTCDTQRRHCELR